MRIRQITHIGWYVLFMAFVVLSLLSLAGCKSTESVETNTESHKFSELIDRMDSISRTTAIWQREIYSKQSSLIDSIREKEKNNTNHSVVLNEKGDTIKEKIIIERLIEKERSTDKQESEQMISQIHQMDSLLHVSLDKQASTDSLLREHMKETVVEKQPTLWQKIKNTVGGYALIVIFIVTVYLGIKLITKWQKSLRGD